MQGGARAGSRQRLCIRYASRLCAFEFFDSCVGACNRCCTAGWCTTLYTLRNSVTAGHTIQSSARLFSITVSVTTQFLATGRRARNLNVRTTR